MGKRLLSTSQDSIFVANQLVNITESSLGYIAGFIDGEGTISIIKTGNSYKSIIAVYNTKIEALNYIKEKIGIGNVVPNYKTEKNNKHNMVFAYLLHNDYVTYHLLNRLLPFLIVKKLQAELVIELCKRKEYYRYLIEKEFILHEIIGKDKSTIDKLNKEALSEFQRFKEKINNLNKRGKWINNNY